MRWLLNRLFRLLFGAWMRPFAGLPGPPPIFPFGNALDFLGKSDRPWEVLADYGKTYGPVCVAWVGWNPDVILNDPALIRQVMETDRAAYYKDNPVGALRPVLTMSSPNINNGDAWTRTRAESPFTQPYLEDWLRAQVPAVRALLVDRAEQLVERTAGGPIALQPELQRIVFDAMGLALVGEPTGNDAYCDFVALADAGSRRMLSPLPFAADLGWRGRRTRARWLAGWGSYIARARAAPDPKRTDLVSMVVRHGTALSDADLAAELGNVCFGGDFSIPSALVTALYMLTQHPAAAATLDAALAALGPDFDRDGLMRTGYVDAVVREALRMRSAVPVWDRRVLADTPTQLAGCTLPANTRVFIVNWLIHHDATHWADPDAYRPERWDGGAAAANPYGSDYFFPLGRGPRICLGLPYADFLMRLLVATWCGRYHVECGRDQAYDAGQRYYFGVRMPWGVTARLTRRAGSAPRV